MATEMATTEVEVPKPFCSNGGKRDITVNVECGGQYHFCARVYQLIASPEFAAKRITTFFLDTNH